MKLSEFVPSPGSSVRVPPSSTVPAGYLDGAERVLLDALNASADRSVASTELARHVRDWPTLYHLTPYRSTILDCLGFDAAGSASVLELGAGCGAITRWLGEHFGTVDAVEGSADRASVARARTAELDHVTLFSANYSLLEEEDAYDAATLIGVLEYSHLYHPTTRDPREASLHNLRVAHRALRDDSVLVIAIENRLGLKYLSGAREDHSSRPYDSIIGYPQTDNAVTFSARALEGLVREAGFDAIDFLLPFPDYKLATTIVDPELARDEDAVANWIQGTAPDWGNARRTPSFSETLAQREIVDAGLLKELANSFIVLAYRGDRDAANRRLGIQRDWVARHYSLDRRAALRKRVTLPAGGDHVVNEVALAAPRDSPELDLGLFQHRLTDEPVARGELAILPVLGTLAAHGVGDELLAHVRRHADWLVEEFGTGRHDADGVPLLDGAAIDTLWINIVADPATGAWSAVDREWRFRGVLPLDYVAWRNLRLLHVRFPDDLPEQWRRQASDMVAFQLAAAAGLMATDARLTLALDIEDAFMKTASTGPLPEPTAGVQALAEEVTGAPRFTIVARAEEVIASPALLAAYAATFDAADASTLVLDPTGAQDELVPRLRTAIVTAGLDEATMPDAVLIEAGEQVFPEAVLTATAWGPAGLPRFAAQDMPALRLLAEDRWTAGA